MDFVRSRILFRQAFSASVVIFFHEEIGSLIASVVYDHLFKHDGWI